MDVTIRLAEIHDDTTIAAYNAAMARETEGLDLDRQRLLPGVRAVLEDPSKGYYLVAEIDGRVVGQMMVTFEWSDWRNGVFWWIQSVFVEPGYRGQGVFRRLYQHLAERARRDPSVCGLRLYVDDSNSAARRTYEALGMALTRYQLYEVDFVIQR